MAPTRSFAVTLLAPALLGACDDAQSQPVDAIVYEISFENRAHHEAEITVTFARVPEGPLELRMSRSSPGRYALHEFAKNVYDVRVTGAGGRAVEVSRPDPHQWTVTGHGGEVTVRYTLYGDHADGTYTGIDRTHAHLNMPATFMWARGLDDRSIELRVRVPDGSGWQVATQLAPTDDPHRFTAPDLAYFLDSPTEVSDFWLRSWEIDGQTIRVALHHAGTEAEAARYADAVSAIVTSSRDLYGTLPSFDFGSYTFLACYLPWVDGDGMEHRNSTVLTSTGSLATNMTGLLGTVAHEFFHAWNVERIRPATLEPFDFERANMSRELWFAEGFTSYFDDLLLWRSGLIGDEAFAQRLGAIANAVTNARGRTYFSPVEMSMKAPFVDAATSVDPGNRLNTFLSYYTWGSGIGMALDLELRSRFDGVTADHVMRAMWETHGVDEVPYEVDDVERAVARITGDADFAADFFTRFVRGREAPDFRALLTPAGIEVSPARPGTAWLGPLSIRFQEGGPEVMGTPREETSLYAAGVDRGDRIVSIGGRPVIDRAALDAILSGLEPGASVEIRYESRGEARTATVTVGEDLTLVGRWTPDDLVDPEQSAFRSAWRTPPSE
jgi:predicted metalloprotease with PDZ domain